MQPNNSFKPTPHRGSACVLYATLARSHRAAAGRLNSGVSHQGRPHVKTIYKVLAACVALSVFGAGVLAYFIRTIDVDRQIVYDGLGRALSEPPRWARIFIDQPA